MKSKIFDEYAKLASELGWIAEAKDSPEEIEDLYNVRPNGDEDDRTLMEKAHPNGGLVVSPAYDAVNGIAMTNPEQSSLMAQIATNPPNGNYTQVPWIQRGDELKRLLVRMAFKLDSENETELMALADECLGGVVVKTSSFQKEASWIGMGARLLGAIVLPGIASKLFEAHEEGQVAKGIKSDSRASGRGMRGMDRKNYSAAKGAQRAAMSSAMGRGAALGGTILLLYGLVNNINPVSQGILNDLEFAKEELKDATDDVHTPAILIKIMARITKYMSSVNKWLSKKRKILTLTMNMKNTVQENKDSEANELKIEAAEFQKETELFVGFIDRALEILSTLDRKESDWIKEFRPLKTVVRWIEPHDLDEAIGALQTAKKSAEEMVKEFNEVKKEVDTAVDTEAAKALEYLDDPIEAANDNATQQAKAASVERDWKMMIKQQISGKVWEI